MPPVPKPSRIRDRQKPRATKGQRASRLLDRVDRARVDAINAELAIRQLEATPADDRGSRYEDELADARKALDLVEAKAKATEAQAEALLGRKIGAKETRERRKAVLRQQADLLAQNLDAWDGTLDDHLANLAEADVVPEADRDEAWDQAQAADEAAVATITRAITAGEAMLAAIKADTDFDAKATAPELPELAAERDAPEDK